MQMYNQHHEAYKRSEHNVKLLEEIQLQPVASLKGKDLLTLLNYTSEEVYQLVDLAIKMKTVTKSGKCPRLLEGKTLGMIFEKSSTRTRVSFEVGMQQLGGYGMYMNARDMQIGRGEPISDTGKVLSGYCFSRHQLS